MQTEAVPSPANPWPLARSCLRVRAVQPPAQPFRVAVDPRDLAVPHARLCPWLHLSECTTLAFICFLSLELKDSLSPSLTGYFTFGVIF